jgi:hypothetical protein
MAHYLVKNAAGDIKHIVGRPAMIAVVQRGYEVIEQWFR